jgi:hypothetical protein
MIIEQINSNFIGYNNNHVIHTKEYYDYIVIMFKSWLSNKQDLNVVIGNYNINFNNTNKTIKVDIQCEHTLVKEGGRSVNELIYGNVKHTDGYYLVRIDKYNYFNLLDVIIEYSLANMFNISSSGKFNDFYNKLIYIAPIIFDINFKNENKTDIITLFANNGNIRRDNILRGLNELKVPNNTIETCFTKECLLALYDKTKIMLNVHQTDHHHTFEELRVLPALLNGVVIVSEESPLKNVIPYSDYIVWSDYDDIPRKTLEVYNNYEYYYNKFFVEGNLKNILNDMVKNNITNLNNIKI